MSMIQTKTQNEVNELQQWTINIIPSKLFQNQKLHI
jgi:hypothetical protein